MIHRYAMAALLLGGLALAQEMELQVELLNGVGTQMSRNGDPVSARIVFPEALRDSVVEGRVTQSISGARSRGASTLNISFDTLRHGGALVPIRSRVVSVDTGAGQLNADAQGRFVIQAPKPAPRQSSGTGGLGRALGGAVGGRGARIGSAVDHSAGAAGGAGASGGAPDLTFGSGSKFVLRASPRSGGSLASVGVGGAAPSPGPNRPPTPAPVTTATTDPATPSVYQPPLSAAAAPAPGQAPAPAAPAAGGSGQPDLVAVKAEFVPGDKAFFYDDFTDMTGEDAPPHWKVRGGTAELRKGEDVRQLTMTARRTTLTPNLTGFPKNFTMETVMKINGHGSGMNWLFRKKGSPVEVMFMRFDAVYTKMSIVCRVGRETIISQQIPMDWTKPIRQALWLQNGRLRLYINGDRIFDANQIDVGELASVDADVFMFQTPGQPEKFVGFQSVRFAESVPDFSQVLTSAGRYIVRGILFDTDSDRLKPESAPAVRQIAKALESNPALKLMIEGHTDSVGDAGHNMDLSKRRAEAVKTVLVGQFKVDASRLSSAGMGATKPMESNDTPQGRAQNRRVELVKL